MIVLHHGSTVPINDGFRPLTHFGTRRSAIARALHQAKAMEQPFVWIHEAVLDIDRPIQIEDIGRHSLIAIADHIHYRHVPRSQRIDSAARDRVFRSMAAGEGESTFAVEMRRAGHDGFVYVNRHEDRGSRSMIIIEPGQAVMTKPPIRMTFDDGMREFLATETADMNHDGNTRMAAHA